MAISDVLTHVRRLVSDEPWQDTLSGAYTAAGTSVSFTIVSGWEFGDVLDFPGASSGGSYEQMKIKDTTATQANPVSDSIGHNDTTNQNHASGAVVLKNHRNATDQIVKAATHVVDTLLYPDLWVVSTSTITPSVSTTNVYDTASDFIDVLDYKTGLVQTATGSIEDLTYSPYQLMDTVPTAISATNRAIRVTNWSRTDVTATFFYKAKVTTTNMTSTMEPVIALGTAWYLLKAEALEKNDRFDEDDRPGRMQRLTRELERDFNNEKRRVRQQLLKQYGPPARRFRR